MMFTLSVGTDIIRVQHTVTEMAKEGSWPTDQSDLLGITLSSCPNCIYVICYECYTYTSTPMPTPF